MSKKGSNKKGSKWSSSRISGSGPKLVYSTIRQQIIGTILIHFVCRFGCFYVTKDGFPFLVHYRSCRDLDDRLSGRHRDASDDEVEPSREAIRLSNFSSI